MNMNNTLKDKLAQLFNHLEHQGDNQGSAMCEDLINSLDSLGNNLLTELMMEQQEIISSPIRFNGVSVQKIKQIFERHGITFDIGF